MRMEQFLKPTMITDGLAVLRADNPSEMTLEGTNSYLLFDPATTLQAGTEVIVVDPGPEIEEHLATLASYNVQLILITHRHADHTEGIDRLVELTGAPVRARLAKHCRAADVFEDLEVISAAGTSVRVEFTPGHTSDSVCFIQLAQQNRLLTGDTVLGRGTTIIDSPDGTLRDYLSSLDRLLALEDMSLHPAHGPQHEQSHKLLTAYRTHRMQRLDQVRAALVGLSAHAADVAPEQLVAAVYPEIDANLVGAAARSLEAQLTYLASQS